MIDFGFAISCKEKIKTSCGTPAYMAPELTLEQTYTQKVDVWALGVVLYAIVNG